MSFTEAENQLFMLQRCFLTSSNLSDDSLSQSSVLSQLLSKALTHVVIDVIGSQELFKSLKCWRPSVDKYYAKEMVAIFLASPFSRKVLN